MNSIEIRPCGPVKAVVRPPGSKSITNRALVCAALAKGTSALEGALDSDDTRLMVAALDELGIAITWDQPASRIIVTGCDGDLPRNRAELFVGNSGTTVRFLAAVVALGHGIYRLDGTPRMRERPIEDLLDGLRQLGADAVSESGTFCPPVIIRSAGLPGGKAAIRGDVSSQFLSGLLLAAPYASRPVELLVVGPLVSQPYIRMTLAVMSSFGVCVPNDPARPDRFLVPTEGYAACGYAIEPDASAASYFFGAAAVTGGQVTVSALSRESLQGDLSFVDVLARMGCTVRFTDADVTVTGGRLAGIEVDMTAISDTVPTLAAVALFAAGPTTITGVAHIRHKETDRVAALAAELRKLGAKVDERSDGLKITPGNLRGATIATYDDHRMAMSLALVGLRTPGVVIMDPGCTAKTYPRFFEDLATACGEPVGWDKRSKSEPIE